jgi:CRP-like cAMP-binding protein
MSASGCSSSSTVRHWTFRAALKEHPSLAVKMLEELASRVRTANPSVSD